MYKLLSNGLIGARPVISLIASQTGRFPCPLSTGVFYALAFQDRYTMGCSSCFRDGRIALRYFWILLACSYETRQQL
jgi:hypothetical protein